MPPKSALPKPARKPAPAASSSGPRAPGAPPSGLAPGLSSGFAPGSSGRLPPKSAKPSGAPFQAKAGVGGKGARGGAVGRDGARSGGARTRDADAPRREPKARAEAPSRARKVETRPGDGPIRVILARGKSKPFWVGHPWVFSGAIATVHGDIGELGGPCVVEDERDNVLGWGYYNPSGQIAVRLWAHRRSTEQAFEPPRFADFLAARVKDALALRVSLGLSNRSDLNVYRLINAEGDGLSGLIVDRLGDTLSVQLNARGMVEQRATVLETLRRLTGLSRMLVAVPDTAARMEGLIPSLERVGPADFLAASTLSVVENGLSYEIDLSAFQKTGFYADQRDNRLRFGALCAGQRVLDAYCHSGGFGLQAARQGASHVTLVDSSEPTIAAARRNAARNGLADRTELLAEDAITFLKEKQALGERWGRIIVDPPKFAQGRGHLDDALQKYARLNTLALSALADDGLMLTCSCSRHVSEEDFGRMLTDAGHRLRKTVRVLGSWGQPADHPTVSVAPEGRYLKVWLVAAS
jgi:23S rRNA (cytosine1962-C5)-methyltransferase